MPEPISDRDKALLLRDKYKGVPTESYKQDLERLARGEPLDYLIGWKPFLGTCIMLNHRPLIPREETEYWVSQAIQQARRVYDAPHCLDLFAGSGCIGIALLAHLPKSSVVFADNAENALAQIRENLEQNALPETGSRARVVHSDVFTALDETFDIICANPPYIDAGREETQASVVEYEPAEALFAPERGLALIDETLRHAHRHLAQDGVLFIEFDEWQKDALETRMDELPYREHTFHRDQFGRWRFLEAHC